MSTLARFYLLQQQDDKAQATHQNQLIYGTVFVNWGYLSEQLDKCPKCGVGSLNLKNTTKRGELATNERRASLGYLTRIRCDYGQEINVAGTDEVHTKINQRGPKR